MTGFDESAAVEAEQAEDEAARRSTDGDDVETLWDSDADAPDAGMTPPE